MLVLLSGKRKSGKDYVAEKIQVLGPLKLASPACLQKQA